MGEEENITISKVDFDYLNKMVDWLKYLESAGVDNWPGIDYARELAEEDGFFSDD